MKSRCISSVIAILLLAVTEAGAQITYNWAGEVGTDPSFALTTTGLVVGNNGWFLNGSLLAAGTTISFSLTIPGNAIDTDPSTSSGRFTGGLLYVSILQMGVNSAASEPFDLLNQRGSGAGSADSVIALPTDNSGFAIAAFWPSGTNPWPDPNTASTVANPAASDVFGTSPNSSFSLTLLSGDVLSTNASEALVNPRFSSVPEPSSIFLLGIAASIFCLRLRARKKTAQGVISRRLRAAFEWSDMKVRSGFRPSETERDFRKWILP